MIKKILRKTGYEDWYTTEDGSMNLEHLGYTADSSLILRNQKGEAIIAHYGAMIDGELKQFCYQPMCGGCFETPPEGRICRKMIRNLETGYYVEI